MEEKELLAKEILNQAIEETIQFAAVTKAPIADIVYDSTLEEEKPIHVYVLFEDIAQLKAMEEENLKDSFMSVFIKYLTGHEFPFGDSPKLSFEFSIQI